MTAESDNHAAATRGEAARRRTKERRERFSFSMMVSGELVTGVMAIGEDYSSIYM